MYIQILAIIVWLVAVALAVWKDRYPTNGGKHA